jgi:N6-L-threonylcarbamoyladenine synthase
MDDRLVAKMAKIGYPGGPIIDKMAQKGEKSKYNLPFLLKNNNKYKNKIIFSFSGIKTAVRNILESEKELNLNDLMACFQNRVIELIERKLNLAFSLKKYKALVVAGGVSANSELRKVVEKIAKNQNIELFLPELKYCQDNGAMVAAAGLELFKRKDFSNLNADVSPTTRIKR